MKVLDFFYENLSKRPDSVVFEDSLRNQALTLGDLDEISAKVYGFLLSRQIGTEDVVAVSLPRGVYVPAVMLGVIKAGAAFVVIGEKAGQKNAEFFIKDSSPKCIITPEVMEEILKSEPVFGHKEASPGDLACIVYSSGSSGYFKGSMHEYGQYDKCIDYCMTLINVHNIDISKSRCAIVQGFYGISGIIYTICGFVLGNYNDIVPYEILNDTARFKQELIDKKIGSTTLSPLHVKDGSFLDGTYLKYANVVFETFGGVYSDKIPLVNRYGMTEYFVVMCQFYIDKPYELTPIGKPLPFVTMYLSEENGKEVPDGQIGEITVKSEHFRGYVNRPEDTRKALVDGYIRTGDMAVKENGQYVILGRKMDLLRTEEGYIVPCKIAIEVRKATGLSWCYVRCFAHSPRPIVCVYYTEDVEIDLEALRKKLSANLPEFMLPTHVVKLDGVDHFTSGKTNRFFFKSPVEDQC